VQNAVEGPSLSLGGGENPFESGSVRQFSLDELHASRQKVAPPVAQVIKNHGLMAVFRQQASHRATDVSRAASYQNFHKKTSLPNTMV
jgi:hypothetical protein